MHVLWRALGHSGLLAHDSPCGHRCAEPEHDDRKLMGVKWTAAMLVLTALAVYYKRWKWAPLKSRRVIVDVVN
jgi:hypothetical protein